MNDPTNTSQSGPLGVGGEMAALMRSKDWSETPLGRVDTWPHSLRTVVRVLLTSRFAMWMTWGPDLTVLYNDAYAAMTLGAKHPWALGRPAQEVWAEIWPEIGPRIDQVLQTGEATWDEDLLLYLERSGYPEETYHTFSYSPIADDDGRVAGHLCVVTEQTDRVIGERRMALLRDTGAAIAATIAESELFVAIERALSASEDLPFTLIYLTDPDSDEAHLVCRAGMSPDHPAALASIPIDGRDSLWPVVQVVSSGTGQVVALADTAVGSYGRRWQRPVTHVMIMPMTQPGLRRPVGIIVAGLNPARPIDQPYCSFVGLLVAQLTAGVANAHAYAEERRRAQALAELDRTKTTFFSNVSHEFRTPLTLLLGPLERVMESSDTLSEPVRDQIDLAHRNGIRLLKLVNTLLDFSRIEAGRMRARFAPTDLGALTTDLASAFRSAMATAGLTYVVETEPLGAPVFVDSEMWEKIVLNLISNALKFTLTGSVTVSLTRQDDRAILVVTDTGVGIPLDEQPRVFERFHRVDGGQGRSHEGSGIGLALVHELARLHGAQLTVASEPGRGSRFAVSLPFGSTHLPADQVVPVEGTLRTGSADQFVAEALRWLPAAPAVAAETVDTVDAVPELAIARILLADDNADMRDYAGRLLEERWHVDRVGDGRAALALARERRPDVIVTDVMMPELDGFGLVRELRKDPDLRAIPVIMLSARAGEEARIEGLVASADDYLVKPFSARELMARVDVQIGRSRVKTLEQEHARRMTELFAHAPVAIAVVRGPDHIYELANQKYRDLVGGRDVSGASIRDALPELAEQGITDDLDAVRTSRQPHVGRSVGITLRRGQNAPHDHRFFDVVYQPVLDADGEVETIVVIAHDVTALAEARDEAETASRVKDEFLATLSHELRTPLNAVLGYTQMLRAGLLENGAIPAALETIERNVRLQEKLIADVLDVSRIITGKLRIDIRPVDLTRVIQDALATVAPAAAAKGIRLQSAIDQPGEPVAGDAERLQQVLWNLLSNAIKFTPKGGRVQVRYERVNSHAEVSVSDTGEGISAEFLPHLFQRFTQAESGFTRTHGGLGLGLAISRHLVEAHGGRIEARSPGKGLGTTIRVELPLMIVHDHRTEPPRVHPALEIAGTTDLHLANLTGLTVLLVDDDADALAMARDALTFAGATVVTASSASSALAALDGDRIDAAVLDIGLPEVDGYGLLRQIRERAVAAQGAVPAAALSAYARASDRTRSLREGFQMHLSKPIQPTELAAAVLSLARHRGVGP